MSENIVEKCIEEVKAKNSLLIISIEKEGGYHNIFTSTDVGTKIEEIGGVLLEISSDSGDYENFRQIYKVGIPPLICIISSDGIVLDVVRGGISQENFMKVLNFSSKNLGSGDKDQGYHPFQELLTFPTPDIKPVREVLIKSPKKSPIITVTENTQCKTPPRNPTPSLYRLKFNISNGSQVSDSFESGTTLGELKQFLKSRIPNARRFVIIRPHPREEFSSEQDKMTLKQLDIQSGSSLIVRLEANDKNSLKFWGFLTAIYSILISIYAYFFPTRNTPQTVSQNRGVSDQTPPNKSPLNSPEKDRMVATHAKTNTSSRVVNRRDNMYRLSDLNKKDDDNSTYNGNSTQQQ